MYVVCGPRSIAKVTGPIRLNFSQNFYFSPVYIDIRQVILKGFTNQPAPVFSIISILFKVVMLIIFTGLCRSHLGYNLKISVLGANYHIKTSIT